jgi:hypothetical protein
MSDRSRLVVPVPVPVPLHVPVPGSTPRVTFTSIETMHRTGATRSSGTGQQLC